MEAAGSQFIDCDVQICTVRCWPQSGTTVLIAACQENHTDVVRVLLRHGARVNIANKFSRYTPLMAAARHANFEVVKMLLKAGANPLAVELVRHGAVFA